MKKQHNEPNLFAFQYKEFTMSTLLYGNFIIPLAISCRTNSIALGIHKNKSRKVRAVQWNYLHFRPVLKQSKWIKSPDVVTNIIWACCHCDIDTLTNKKVTNKQNKAEYLSTSFLHAVAWTEDIWVYKNYTENSADLQQHHNDYQAQGW